MSPWHVTAGTVLLALVVALVTYRRRDTTTPGALSEAACASVEAPGSGEVPPASPGPGVPPRITYCTTCEGPVHFDTQREGVEHLLSHGRPDPHQADIDLWEREMSEGKA